MLAPNGKIYAIPANEPDVLIIDPITQTADILMIIGTSMQVYPAAGLVNYVNDRTPIYFIDPKPTVSRYDFENLTIIPKNAGEGVSKLVSDLLKESSAK